MILGKAPVGVYCFELLRGKQYSDQDTYDWIYMRVVDCTQVIILPRYLGVTLPNGFNMIVHTPLHLRLVGNTYSERCSVVSFFDSLMELDQKILILAMKGSVFMLP